MSKHILIIDDEREQAEGLAKLLTKEMGAGFTFEPLWEEAEIENAVNDRAFSVVVLDIRMDGMPFNGMDLFDKIIQQNSMARVVFVSAYLAEFGTQLNEALATGNVLAVQPKAEKEFNVFAGEIAGYIRNFFVRQGNELSENSKVLMAAYERAKNTGNSQEKGLLFEEFLVSLFSQIGFSFIQKRVKDMTSEVDLVLRNDLNDAFISKFGKYIFVEAKNRPSEPVNKNDLVVFRDKLDSSNHLAQLGILASAHNVASTVRSQMLRDSREDGKILLLTNNELIRLIRADDKLYEFKKLIDEQIKDTPA
jgi:response regulator receiver domain|nr:MAG TPA: response regulator [Caudoviricetes sp.]